MSFFGKHSAAIRQRTIQQLFLTLIAILYVNFRPKIGVIYDTLPLRINSLSPQVYLSLKESFHTVYISLPKINILLIYFFWLISKN